MKNLNILGVHWKIGLLGGGGGSPKTNIEGGIAKKGRAWTVCKFKGAWQERRGCFWGGGRG